MRATAQALQWVMAVVPLLVGGCAMFQQERNEAYVRKPGDRSYGPPVDVSISAKTLWEYAVLSENVYIGDWKKQRADAPKQKARVLLLPRATPEAYAAACVPERIGPLPLPGWTMWEDFPSPDLIQEALRVGLFMEVWERESSPAVIAVVFRGTEFKSWKDWVSNLRWFLRFIPFHSDQYTLIARQVGKEFVDRLTARPGFTAPGAPPIRVVATGHSLGGGLAQHFSYSMPSHAADGTPVSRVANVYAFDPSPVTGWFSVRSELRRTNAADLWIDRAFEHGEILAYARLLLSYALPPSAAHPSIQEIRYNFVRSANPLSSHSMRLLACALMEASGQTHIPDLFKRFQVPQ